MVTYLVCFVFVFSSVLRYGHTAVQSRAKPGVILVVGGKRRDTGNNALALAAPVFVLDTEARRWSQADTLGKHPLPPRYHHICGGRPDGGLLVFGGTCFRKYSGNSMHVATVTLVEEQESETGG